MIAYWLPKVFAAALTLIIVGAVVGLTSRWSDDLRDRFGRTVVITGMGLGVIAVLVAIWDTALS